MKFGHVVLLCKGWYKYRDNERLDTLWLDMAHAIDADGWTMQSRSDVAYWCLCRLDDMRDDPLLDNYKNQFRLTEIFKGIDRMMERAEWWNHKISREDAIIWTFHSIVSNLENKCFTEWIKPDARVLPVNLGNAWYDDGKYNNDHKPVYHFAEMMCDYEAKVKEYLPKAKEWKPFYSCDSYDYREGFLKKDSWEDVQIELGEDNLNDCIELTITAKELKTGSIKELNTIFELGKFNNCKDIEKCEDPEKKYICRFLKRYDEYWDDYDYTLKSIKEYDK